MNIEIEQTPQVEALRIWWASHGKKVAYLAMAVAVAIGGWKYIDSQNKNRLEKAAAYYEEMQNSLRRNNTEEARLQAEGLMKQFSKTPYAAAAGLYLAKEAVHAEKFEEAKTHLGWVIDYAKHSALEQLARTRLARIYLYEKSPEKVLDILKKNEKGAYAPVYAELKGDAYQLQGKLREAKESYQKAKDLYKEKELTPILLEMKLNEIAS